MAERKAAVRPAPDRPALDELLERARTTPMSDEMVREQRISFVYGNAPVQSRITKDSARRSVARALLVSQ
jgi:hypothetical protein